ncbi:Hypothetical predicted protein, partial [Paramuricea clavata]
MKKAKSLLKKHPTSLAKPHKTLFGKKFYKALHKATQLRKSSKEISHHITGPPHQKIQKNGANRNVVMKYQPFRQGPSFQSRGGGRPTQFRGRESGYRGSGYRGDKGYPFKGKSLLITFEVKRRSPESHLSPLRPGSGHSTTDCSAEHPSCLEKSRARYINFTLASTPCRETPVFPEKLGMSNWGSVYSADSLGGQNTISGNPCSKQTSSSPHSYPVRKGKNQAGSCGNAAEGSVSGGLSTQRGLSQSNIFSTEEGWGEQACAQFERVEFTHRIPALQNGGSAPPQTTCSKQGLHDQNRPQGCLFFSTHEQTTSTFPNVHLGGRTVSIHLPSLWVSTSSSIVHKAVEASSVAFASPGFEDDNLSRRHNCFEPNSGRHIKGQGLSPVASAELGFCDQLGKVGATTLPYHGVSRICDKFSRDEAVITRNQNESSCAILPISDSTTGVLGQNNSKGDREADILHAGIFPSTLALSTPATVTNQRSVDGKILRDDGLTRSELSQRPSMVDRSDLHLEWSSNNCSCPRS